MLFLFREHILSTAAASPSGASIILGEHVSGTSRSTHSLKTLLCFCVEEKIIANNNNSGGFKLSPSPYSEDYRVIAQWWLFVRPCAVPSMHVLMGTFCYTGVRSQLVLFNTALLLQCELIKKKGKKKKGSFIWELQIAREVLQSRRMINEPLLCFSPRTASSGKGWKSGSKSCKIKNKKKKPFQLGSAEVSVIPPSCWAPGGTRRHIRIEDWGFFSKAVIILS